MLTIRDDEKYLQGMTFIDLFAGIGGFRLALESLGAKCVYSNEWNKAAQKTYEMNFGEVPEGDITQVSEKSVPDHDILCAGFPCQAFSISGKQYGFSDTRGTLFFDVARIIREKRPKIVFMENVKNLVAHDGGNTMKVIANTMEQLGYTFQHVVMDSVDYGAPTVRQRCYMVCFRKDLGIDGFEFPAPDHKALKVVKDILMTDDKELEGLWVSRPDTVITCSDAQAKSRRPVQLGHVAQGRQGERIYSINGPAITLSAHGGGAFAKTGGYMVKPGKYRRLHPRECARVMGFPESYKLNPSRGQAYQQFGNSVVVDVIQYIAREFGRVYRDKYPLEQDEQQ